MPDPRATSQFCAFYSFTGILFMVRVFSWVVVGFVEYFVRMTAHPTRRLRIEGSGNAYVTASRRAVVWQHMLERGGT